MLSGDIFPDFFLKYNDNYRGSRYIQPFRLRSTQDYKYPHSLGLLHCDRAADGCRRATKAPSNLRTSRGTADSGPVPMGRLQWLVLQKPHIGKQKQPLDLTSRFTF